MRDAANPGDAAVGRSMRQTCHGFSPSVERTSNPIARLAKIGSGSLPDEPRTD